MTDVPVYLSQKRKRGRPRKDGNLYRENSYKKLSNPNLRKTLNIYKDDNTAEAMVGSTVHGVIEGSFDAGYLISVRTANSCTSFRGVVFQSEKVVPVTPANDIAPNAKMYQRREILVPAHSLQNQFSGVSPFLPCGPQASIAPKMYQRREIPVPAHSLQNQFSGVSPVLPCGPQASIAPFKFTSHSTFSVTEPTLPRIGLCCNVGGNATVMPREYPRLGVHNGPSSAFAIENIKQDELIFGLNMYNVVKTGDMVSEPSFESMFNDFLGNSVKSEPGSSFLMQNKLQGSNVELHNNFAPQSGFETQQNTMDHSEMNNNLDLSFHQNLFTYQEQPKSPESNFHQVNFNEGALASPSLKLHLASVTQEKKSLQQPESSNAPVETKYLVPSDFKSPESETNLALKSVTGTGERFHDKEGTSLAEAGSPGPGQKDTLELATLQSTPERRRVKQTGSAMESITDMDYVLSDVVTFAESPGSFLGN